MDKIVSSDGTSIAFERRGSGPALILCAGALTDLAAMRPLAAELADSFSVFTFDRRGRGDSGNSEVNSTGEVEDVAALIEAAGGHAFVYGHSTGAGLAFQAAVAGLPIDRLVLHEPPFRSGAETAVAKDYWRDLNAVIGGDEGAARALELFLVAYGVTPEGVKRMKGGTEWNEWVGMGESLVWDSAAMNDAEGGTVPYDQLDLLKLPVLMLEGSDPEMVRIGTEMAEVLPNGTLTVLEGAGHEPPPELIAPAVFEFLQAD